MTTTAHAVNAYRIPALYGRHSLALTNTTPTTAYRGAGRPNVSYLIERLVEQAARETGRERIELRRLNLFSGPFTLENYQDVVGARDFCPLLRTTFIYAIFGTALPILMGLAAAMVVRDVFVGRPVLRW